MDSVLTTVVVGISVVEDAVVTDVVTGAVVSEVLGIVVEVRVSDFEVTTVDVVSSVVEGVVDEACSRGFCYCTF